MKTGKIVKVAGPLVVAEGMEKGRMYDVVRVSEKRLVGEIIELKEDKAWIQVYEDTTGVGAGEKVELLGYPLSIELGPGLVGAIYDGVQRPLDAIKEKAGDFITRGIDVPGLDHETKWEFKATAKEGDEVRGGDILGEVDETKLVKHKILVPPDVKGKIKSIENGSFTIDDTVAVVETKDGERQLKMYQRWPVRKSRPYAKRLNPENVLVTGQRVIDTFFPVNAGGTACVPGPFGSGKTVIQHQLAKWAEAEIIVYVGCGERGNEMTDVLQEFPELKDPRTGEPLMKRTVLIANTSNMPVAAREASVYTGITIAEYFRDMGYSVALMADSTSRWAEAMREISGRLEEMPGEEGYPAYLSRRIAEFYERAGRVVSIGTEGREGKLTVIGAVSPPGGDLSDPVVQSTLRVVKVFWSLEDKLAYRRHFPAINWLTSYSLYASDTIVEREEDKERKELLTKWIDLRGEAMRILQDEASLEEIVRLVGVDALSREDRLILLAAKSIREDYLQQHAFDEVDTHTSFKKQVKMLEAIISAYKSAKDALSRGVAFDKIEKNDIWNKIARMKQIAEENISDFNKLKGEITKTFESLA